MILKFLKGAKLELVKILEAANLSIKNVLVKNSEIGIVSKDSSNVQINNFNVNAVKVPLASYIKKPELGIPSIKLKNVNTNLNNFLISKDSNVFISGKKIKSELSSKYINEIFYGGKYGKKTIR